MARRPIKRAKDAKPSARLVKASELIAGGASVPDAMAAAGYGAGCIDGLAPQFMGVLAAAGLAPKPRAKKAAPAPDDRTPAGAETLAVKEA